MIKPKYKCIKSWTFTNLDGTKVEIFEGEKIKVKMDLKTTNFSDYFIEELSGNDTVCLDVLEIFKTKIRGRLDGCYITYISLFPKNIIEITKV